MAVGTDDTSQYLERYFQYYGVDNTVTPPVFMRGLLEWNGAGWQKLKVFADTITEYNITLAVVDTEYSQALPAGTRAFEFQNRSNNDIRYSFTTGKVATPTAPYSTLKAGQNYYKELTGLTTKTIYFANANAGDVVEVMAFA